MAKRTNQVTRRVTESREIEIYKVKPDLSMELLTKREVKGKVGEGELIKEFNIDKKKGESIFIKQIKENVVTYAMSTEEFMKHAVVVENEE